MTRSWKAATIAVLVLVAAPAQAQDASGACFAATPAVLKLAYPSRYTKDSKSRSDFDEKADAAVDAALKPVDDFIVDLATTANRSLTEPDAKALLAADCVVDRIHDWAAISSRAMRSLRMNCPALIT